MDIKKLKYMTKLAMKYAKYNSKADKFYDIAWEAVQKDDDKKNTKYTKKAEKFKSKAYYIREVYNLEVANQGILNKKITEWDEL